MDIGDWSYGDLLDTAAGQRRRIAELEEENQRLRDALKSIAANTCCDRCQEAALVAKAALLGGGDGR